MLSPTANDIDNSKAIAKKCLEAQVSS